MRKSDIQAIRELLELAYRSLQEEHPRTCKKPGKVTVKIICADGFTLIITSPRFGTLPRADGVWNGITIDEIAPPDVRLLPFVRR
jgi:hypothetical protein